MGFQLKAPEAIVTTLKTVGQSVYTTAMNHKLNEKQLFCNSLYGWLGELVEDEVADILWLAFTGTVRVTSLAVYQRAQKFMWRLNPGIVYRLAYIDPLLKSPIDFTFTR